MPGWAPSLSRLARAFAPALTLASLTLGCACDRTEEPAAPTTSEPAPSSGGSSAGSTSAASAGSTTTMTPMQPATSSPSTCVVPMQPAPVASKATECPQDPDGNLTLPHGRVTFVDAPGAPAVAVELARDAASIERGLMYRTSMPDNDGMLFTFQDQRIRTFWMKNTCIPLDMLFIRSDGVIAGILEQVPTLNQASRSVPCPTKHVLELNAGWARAHGVTPGMKVTIEG